MQKLTLTIALLSIIALPVLADQKKPATQSPQKCEISCNPEYRKADDELNQTWRDLSKTERQILRPSQRQWIKDRDRTCGKDDNCLADTTKKQTDQLRRVNSCVKNQGGISCFENRGR